jgi:hypothetical protein
MFDFLRSYDDGGVDHRFFALFLEDFRSFLDQAFHCFAGLTLRRFANVLENFLEAFDMTLGLFQMFFERVF